jgi:hypothetical protein
MECCGWLRGCHEQSMHNPRLVTGSQALLKFATPLLDVVLPALRNRQTC